MNSFSGIDLFDPSNSNECISISENYLPPEPQSGNVEYKLKLVRPTSNRLMHLVTQMKWRLREGQGEAIYEIGVEDNGLLTGLSEEDMKLSLNTLREMAQRLGATISILRERQVEGNRTVAEILIRKVPEDQQYIDLRVCVLGSADVGKSTLLGVLTNGELDNGRGKARLNMLRHLHEVQSGRTSSISHEILGFNSQGRSVDYQTCSSAEEICENSSKLITFVDLAGHQKYLKTTITGLTSYSPHYIMLVVSASSGITSMMKEHLGIVMALELPFFITVTKVDITSKEQIETTLESLKSLLSSPGFKKIAFNVKSGDDVISVASNNLYSNVVPIFLISSVTGSKIDLVKKYLHLLPPSPGSKEKEKLEDKLSEFQIDELFDVPGVGTVVGGLLTHGIITEGMKMYIGPFDDGDFRPVLIQSIKRNRRGCRLVRATQSAALSINMSLVSLRRGMVLLDSLQTSPFSCRYFQASICLLFHPTEICKGYRITVHVGNVRQTAVILGISPIHEIKSNDEASIILKFIRMPEYIKVGSRLLFREGRTKGIGRVTQVFPGEPKSIDYSR